MFLFVQWKEYFHSVKDENILTIALINIHYLYNRTMQNPNKENNIVIIITQLKT